MSPPAGPYSAVRRVGDWVVTSGQLGTVAGADGRPELVAGGTVAQLRQALANLVEVLASAGAGVPDVVKATVFMIDLDEFAAMNEVWVQTFDEPRPARSAVGVAALPLGARIEVEAWAHVAARP